MAVIQGGSGPIKLCKPEPTMPPPIILELLGRSQLSSTVPKQNKPSNNRKDSESSNKNRKISESSDSTDTKKNRTGDKTPRSNPAKPTGPSAFGTSRHQPELSFTISSNQPLQAPKSNHNNVAARLPVLPRSLPELPKIPMRSSSSSSSYAPAQCGLTSPLANNSSAVRGPPSLLSSTINNNNSAMSGTTKYQSNPVNNGNTCGTSANARFQSNDTSIGSKRKSYEQDSSHSEHINKRTNSYQDEMGKCDPSDDDVVILLEDDNRISSSNIKGRIQEASANASHGKDVYNTPSNRPARSLGETSHSGDRIHDKIGALSGAFNRDVHNKYENSNESPARSDSNLHRKESGQGNSTETSYKNQAANDNNLSRKDSAKGTKGKAVPSPSNSAEKMVSPAEKITNYFNSVSEPMRHDSDDEVDAKKIRGYRNLGNTCYMNAVVSVMTLLRPFANDMIGSCAHDEAHPARSRSCLKAWMDVIEKRRENVCIHSPRLTFVVCMCFWRPRVGFAKKR
jgi:hypothetical protein